MKFRIGTLISLEMAATQNLPITARHQIFTNLSVNCFLGSCFETTEALSYFYILSLSSDMYLQARRSIQTLDSNRDLRRTYSLNKLGSCDTEPYSPALTWTLLLF